jgi:hypothetical protein
MNWKLILAIVAVAPFVAFLGGLGFLFMQIGETWDARSTDSLIAGLVATCGGGAVIIGLLLAIIIGVPFAIRMFREAGMSERAWGQIPPPGYPLLPHRSTPGWMQQPPRLEDKSMGSWNTVGNTYDVWDENDTQPLIEDRPG